jgi:nucleoside-diphosphate-sugar epimerase
MEECDPWLRGDQFPPNFYYRQQDILKDAAAKSNWDWVVTYPNDVIGVAKGNFMNLATSLGLYVAVTKEMGQDLVFPGSDKFYVGFDTFTYSRLHAEFYEWAALEPKARNQAFNMVNGDVESWQNLWPKVARRFGVKIPESQFAQPPTAGSQTKLQDNPPVGPGQGSRTCG